MDKIKALLEKAGCKEELTDKICESLQNYKNTLREQFAAEYAAKIDEAKKICIEETENHKRELARRVQIFCEAKSATIDAQLARQSALNESEAEARLRSIRNMLEGIVPNGQSENGDVAALQKARQQLQTVKEAKRRATETANRQIGIATKAMKQNRQLATENVKLKKQLESQMTVSEGRERRGQRKRRIDIDRRKQQQPVSTRATLTENQDRRPPEQPQRSNVIGESGGFGVQDIAKQMDDDLI